MKERDNGRFAKFLQIEKVAMKNFMIINTNLSLKEVKIRAKCLNKN